MSDVIRKNECGIASYEKTCFCYIINLTYIELEIGAFCGKISQYGNSYSTVKYL